MKNVVLILILIFVGVNLNAQHDHHDQDEHKDKKECKNALKNKHRTHLYWGVQFPVPPENEGSELLYGKSHGFDVGYKSAYMFSKFYGLGLDLSYGYTRYRLDQVATKITPDTETYDKQSLRTNTFKLGLFNRFAFGKKSYKRIDKFIELGVYGAYNFRMRHETENVEGNSTYIGIHKKLDYMEPFTYGAYANVGIKQMVITFQYRYSDLFKDAAYPEFPQYSIGFQMGLHR